MASTIQIKRGTGSAVPSGLADGELAINLDDGRFYFGSGSTSVNSFRFTNLIADNYIVSSSVTNITTQTLSGSTQFGDSADDTHQFTGHITASGAISSSGTIEGNAFNIDNDSAISGKNTFGGSYNIAKISTGNRIILGATNSGLTVQSNNANMTLDSAGNIRLDSDTGDIRFEDGGTAKIYFNTTAGHITASGDISASGYVTATHITASDNIKVGGSTTTPIIFEPRLIDFNPEANGNGIQFKVDDANSKTTFGGLIEFEVQSLSIELGTAANNHVTASGNISASGTITANSFEGAATSVANALTVDDATLQLDSGTTFNGSAARTISVKDGGIDSDALAADLTLVSNDPFNGGSVTVKGTSSTGLKIFSSHAATSRDVGLNISASSNGQQYSLGLNRPNNSFVISPSDVSTMADAGKPVFELDITGNITASGNISSSGTITANGGEFTDDITLGDTKKLKGIRIVISASNNNNIYGTSTFHQNVLLNGGVSTTNITASNNISASGTITGNSIIGTLGTAAQTNITSVGTLGSLTVSGDITANGNIVGDDGTNITNIATIECDSVTHDGDTDTKITFGTDAIRFTAGNVIVSDFDSTSVEFNTPITASGNISSSGYVYTDRVFLQNNDVLRYSSANSGLYVNGGVQTVGNSTFGNGDTDTHTFTGHITASGNISASGTITGQAGLTQHSITGTTAGEAKGDIVKFGGTTSMTAGAIYHYNASSNWELADADDNTKSDGLLGVALGASSDADGVLLRGMVTLDHDPGTVGEPLYLTTTAGDVSSTAPSGNGNIVRIVGYCLNSSNNQIWFNPDSTFVEVNA